MLNLSNVCLTSSYHFYDQLAIGDVMSPFMEYCLVHKDAILLFHYPCEADEMHSFVQQKANKQWIWLAMHTATRQIIAFHVGKRSTQDAQQLWKNIPAIFKEKATFFTDFYKPYQKVIPTQQHKAMGKDKGFTNHQERFNLTMRQRVSRLVRANLAFSKKLDNHIGAIKYFICHYNRQIAEKITETK